MPDDYVKRSDVHKAFQPKYAPAINRTFAAMIDSVPAADVVEARHGKWVESHKHLWQLDESGNIDMWVLDHGFHNGPRCVICGEAFCEHCTPDWKTTKCDTEHYECSECGNISLTKTAYCPSCGAKMDDNVIQHTECVGNALGALDEVEELSRYIDANKMADELSKVPRYEREDEKQAVRMVKEFPTADVVEVVRCRDCFYNRGETKDLWGNPAITCVTAVTHEPDWYCASGKHKAGGRDDD